MKRIYKANQLEAYCTIMFIVKVHLAKRASFQILLWNVSKKSSNLLRIPTGTRQAEGYDQAEPRSWTKDCPQLGQIQSVVRARLYKDILRLKKSILRSVCGKFIQNGSRKGQENC